MVVNDGIRVDVNGEKVTVVGGNVVGFVIIIVGLVVDTKNTG